MSGFKSGPSDGNNPFYNTPNANPSLSSPSTPRRTKKKIVYSDRYIPNRTGLDLQAAFSLTKDSPNGMIGSSSGLNQSSHSLTDGLTGNSHSSGINNDSLLENELDYMKEDEANRTFDAVLKTELFGDNVPSQLTAKRSNYSLNNYNSSDMLNSSLANLENNGGSVPNLVHDSSVSSSRPSSYHSHGQSQQSGQITPPGSNSNRAGYFDTARTEELLRTPRQNANLFTYQSPTKNRPQSSSLNVQNELYSLSPVRADSQKLLLSPQKKPRAISKVPYRVLDAPELADDFYLNLIDWGSQDILGVGLGSSVYLWDASSGSVNRLCDFGSNDSVTSVSWIGAGTHLAVGTNSGSVEIWDTTTMKCTRTMSGHEARTSSLAWNQHILTSGSKDRSILHRDVREAAHYMKRLEHHRQEVCGLKWNIEDNKLASGGNDNKVFVWDGLNSDPLYTFSEHNAAVKAIAWSPHQRGILASGGGTQDGRIKIWNTMTGLKISDTDTGSQICNLTWSKNSNEIVSTHGYSRNQIAIWKYGSMQKIASLTGHTYRVLYLAMSPDGQTIVTGAGDETLRFWNVFEKNKSENGPSSVLLDSFMQLR